jgi:hypothetical protein
LAILAFAVVERVRRDHAPASLALRFALTAASAFVAEETCMHWYGFYGYSSSWSVFLDRMPLTVALIWPVVLQSAWDLTGALVVGKAARVAVATGMVLVDASLMEPIAVKAGLWTWTHPGLFEVPLIGIAGWCFFAVGVFAFWAFDDDKPAPARSAAAAVGGPVSAHALLLAAWWGGGRFFDHEIDALAVVVAAWCCSSLLAFWLLRTGKRNTVPPLLLWVRVPAAGFFFVLLLLKAREVPLLVAYAFAFAPPYLVLTRAPWLARR